MRPALMMMADGPSRAFVQRARAHLRAIGHRPKGKIQVSSALGIGKPRDTLGTLATLATLLLKREECRLSGWTGLALNPRVHLFFFRACLTR